MLDTILGDLHRYIIVLDPNTDSERRFMPSGVRPELHMEEGES